MRKVLKCASCGKKLLEYDARIARKYGSPLKKCKKCGADYLDPRYRELAAEGTLPEEFRLFPCIVMAIAGVLIGWRGQYLFTVRQLGVGAAFQWLLPSVFLIMGCVLFIGGIWEAVSIQSGRKARKFQKLYVESLARMRDVSYAYTLHKLGYPVPEQYL